MSTLECADFLTDASEISCVTLQPYIWDVVVLFRATCLTGGIAADPEVSVEHRVRPH